MSRDHVPGLVELFCRASTILTASFREQLRALRGSRGLGLVMARKLAARGRAWRLARDGASWTARSGCSRRSMGAEVLAPSAATFAAGPTSSGAQVLDPLDHVDVLINNAGVIQVGPLEHMEHEDFENAMATHFWGPLHLMLELIPSMRRRGFGRIVNIARSAARSPCRTSPLLRQQVRADRALRRGSRRAAPHGIRVTTVSRA